MKENHANLQKELQSISTKLLECKTLIEDYELLDTINEVVRYCDMYVEFLRNTYGVESTPAYLDQMAVVERTSEKATELFNHAMQVGAEQF